MLLLLLEEDVLAPVLFSLVLPLVLLLSLSDDLLDLQIHLLECWGWAFFIESLVDDVFAGLVHSGGSYAAIVETAFGLAAQTVSWALIRQSLRGDHQRILSIDVEPFFVLVLFCDQWDLLLLFVGLQFHFLDCCQASHALD